MVFPERRTMGERRVETWRDVLEVGGGRAVTVEGMRRWRQRRHRAEWEVSDRADGADVVLHRPESPRIVHGVLDVGKYMIPEGWRLQTLGLGLWSWEGHCRASKRNST